MRGLHIGAVDGAERLPRLAWAASISVHILILAVPLSLGQQRAETTRAVSLSILVGPRAAHDARSDASAMRNVMHTGAIQAPGTEKERLKAHPQTPSQRRGEIQPGALDSHALNSPSADAGKRAGEGRRLDAPQPSVAARYDADYLSNPRPAYPPMSRRLGEEGRVVLRVRVSADGRAIDVGIAQGSSYARLDEAARTAVERWKFVPARQGDEAVESVILVPLNFRLSET